MVSGDVERAAISRVAGVHIGHRHANHKLRHDAVAHLGAMEGREEFNRCRQTQPQQIISTCHPPLFVCRHFGLTSAQTMSGVHPSSLRAFTSAP